MIDISPLLTREMQSIQESLIAEGIKRGSLKYTVLSIRGSIEVARKYNVHPKMDYFENPTTFLAFCIIYSGIKWPSNPSAH